MRYPDDDVDDFYPQDLTLPDPRSAPKAAPPPAESSARRRLVPGGPELQKQKKFYLYLGLCLGLCVALTVYVMVNRAERQRLNNAYLQLNEKSRQLDESIAGQTAPAAIDGDLMVQRAALLQNQFSLDRQLYQKSRLPYLIYIPGTLLLCLLLGSALTMVGQIGKTVFDFFKGGICLLSASVTALLFNLAFIWYFSYRQMWVFSFAFAAMVLSIVLIISPNLFMVFAGRRLRRNSQKVETLEELQDRLPFED